MSDLSEPKDGGPAFPVECDWTTRKPMGMQTGNCSGWVTGMSLRDYFAAKAMAAFITTPTEGTFNKISETALTWNIVKLSRAAYDVADAMLTARKPTE